MYDLVKDPHELHSVANDPDYQLQRTDLSARADAWWRETGGKDADYYASDAFRDGLNR